MIKRYEHEKIKAIFCPKNRVKIFSQIELALAEKLYLLPTLDIEKLCSDMEEIEKVSRHETVAFVGALSIQLPSSVGPIHVGVTSSDILDTCLAVQMRDACDVLLLETDRLLASLKAFSLKHKRTPMLGRSHGKAGEVTSLGLSFLSYYQEWVRNRKRIEDAKSEVSYGMASGPMGNFTNTSLLREHEVCEDLGLSVEEISTQVIPRDRHAFLMSILGIIGASLERISTHIRNLSQSGIDEVSEFFGVGQKGSSAMPHKKNPILSENVTGISRLLKGMVAPALDNVSLWYERDMSHSSVERVVVEDAFHLACFAVRRMTRVISNLTVDESKLRENIAREGDLVYSHLALCHLVRRGIPRVEAYSFIQRVTQGRLDLFGELNKSFPYIPIERETLPLLGAVDQLFNRVLGE